MRKVTGAKPLQVHLVVSSFVDVDQTVTESLALKYHPFCRG